MPQLQWYSTSQIFLITANAFSELGHMSKNCPEERVEHEGKPDFKCNNCDEEGHRLRDCPKPRIDRDACKNCGKSGHRVADCTEERSAANVECRKCSESNAVTHPSPPSPF